MAIYELSTCSVGANISNSSNTVDLACGTDEDGKCGLTAMRKSKRRRTGHAEWFENHEMTAVWHALTGGAYGKLIPVTFDGFLASPLEFSTLGMVNNQPTGHPGTHWMAALGTTLVDGIAPSLLTATQQQQLTTKGVSLRPASLQTHSASCGPDMMHVLFVVRSDARQHGVVLTGALSQLEHGDFPRAPDNWCELMECIRKLTQRQFYGLLPRVA